MSCFNRRSHQRLNGIHPDLVKVMVTASLDPPIPFQIVEGVRSLQRQKQLLAAKKSKTLRSRHLTGHAVDVGIFNGAVYEQAFEPYRLLSVHVLEVAASLNIDLEWGGAWKTLKDGVHYELTWEKYPI